MKLLIDTDLVGTFPVDPTITGQDYEDAFDHWCDISVLLKKFSVSHSITNFPKKGGEPTVFTVPAQKITLDSVDVNELLFDGFYLLDYEMNYAALGGRGCDLTLILRNLQQ